MVGRVSVVSPVIPTTTFVIGGRATTTRRLTVAVGGVALAFFFAQIGWLVVAGRGWWFDEAIDNVVAQRSVTGHLRSDRFLTWITGSPLSPLLSGLAVRLGGLFAGRAMSALWMSLTGVLVATTAYRYERTGTSRRRAVLAAVACLTSAPALVYGHLISHDVLAALFLAASMSVFHLHLRSRHQDSAVAAGVLLALAILTKYTVGLLVPVIAAYVAVLQGRRARRTLGWAGGALAATGLVGAVILGPQVFTIPKNMITLRYGGVAARPTIALFLAFMYLIPALVLLAGALTARHRRERRLRWICLAGMVLYWAMHLSSSTLQAATRHSMYALILAVPTIADVLTPWTVARRPLRRMVVGGVIAAQLALGIYQVPKYDRSYLDLTEAGDVLAAHWQPGDTLGTDQSWVLVNDLGRRGLLDNPWRVYDSVRIGLERAVDGRGACPFDYVLVDSSQFTRQPLRDVLAGCPRYRLLYRGTQDEVQLLRSGFVTRTITIELYGLDNGGGDERRQAIEGRSR